MSKIPILMLLFFSITFSSCHKRNNLPNDGKTYYIITNENVDSVSIYHQAKPLMTVNVIDTNGVEIKLKPDISSKTIGKYAYAEGLAVIEITAQWFGILQEVRCEFYQNGEKIQRTYMEKVYVQRKAVGKSDQIKILDRELYDIWFYDTINNIEINKVHKHLKIELVDEKEYLAKAKYKIDFVTYDTSLIRKKHGIIEIKCVSKSIKIIDNLTEDTYIQSFSYVGQIPSINKYLVYCECYEGFYYLLIDKNTGRKDTINDFPHLSQDKKTLITLNFDYYDFTTVLQLFSIANDQLELLLETNFSKWVTIPFFNNHDIYSSPDGNFYVPVMHVEYVKYSNDDHFKKTQYLKIKPL